MDSFIQVTDINSMPNIDTREKHKILNSEAAQTQMEFKNMFYIEKESYIQKYFLSFLLFFFNPSEVFIKQALSSQKSVEYCEESRRV